MHEPTQEVSLTLAAKLGPVPQTLSPGPFQELSRDWGHRGPSCLDSDTEGLLLSRSRKPPRPEDEPWGFGEARGRGPGQPCSYIRRRAPCLRLVPRPPSLPELRRASTAAAMKCLLLALSLALVCGTQAIFVPRTAPEDINVQKVWGEGCCSGGDAWGGCELQTNGKLGSQNTGDAVRPGVRVTLLGRNNKATQTSGLNDTFTVPRPGGWASEVQVWAGLVPPAAPVPGLRTAAATSVPPHGLCSAPVCALISSCKVAGPNGLEPKTDASGYFNRLFKEPSPNSMFGGAGGQDFNM